MSEAVVEAIGAALEGSADPDTALREVVRILAGHPGVEHVSIAFAEEGTFVVGPQAGTQDPTRRAVAPVVYQDAVVGELRVDGDLEPELLGSVARLVAAYVLLGWDTGGEAWVP